MRSKTTKAFREQFAALPKDVQRLARSAYKRFQENPSASGLNFESVHASGLYWSVRVGSQYRAVGVRRKDDRDTIVWFWIGTHNAYDKLLNQF